MYRYRGYRRFIYYYYYYYMGLCVPVETTHVALLVPAHDLVSECSVGGGKVSASLHHIL